jgi:hypothetical protein
MLTSVLFDEVYLSSKEKRYWPGWLKLNGKQFVPHLYVYKMFLRQYIECFLLIKLWSVCQKQCSQFIFSPAKCYQKAPIITNSTDNFSSFNCKSVMFSAAAVFLHSIQQSNKLLVNKHVPSWLWIREQTVFLVMWWVKYKLLLFGIDSILVHATCCLVLTDSILVHSTRRIFDICRCHR